MSDRVSRTALVVVCAEADPVVAGWRRRFDSSAVERQLPPHITVLFPLVPAADVGARLLGELGSLYAPVAPFAYELATVEAFPGVAWLAPDPARPFRDLIERTRAAFPKHLPYGDPELEPIPHCTVGVAEDDARLETMVAELRSGLAPSLPIACTADAVWLLEERADTTWAPRASFPFGGSG